MTWTARTGSRIGIFGAVVVAALLASTAPAPGSGRTDADGRVRTPQPGFLLDRGRLTTFDVPGARVATSPLGINNLGRIVGKYNDGTATSGPGASEHGFVRDRRGRFTTFDVPGARGTAITRINDHGQMVGIYSRRFGRVGDDDGARGFLLDRGRLIRIDVPGAAKTQPFGLNNRRQVVGEYFDASGKGHGFLWDNGRFITLDVPGADGTVATDINDRGEITGGHAALTDPPTLGSFLFRKGRYTTFAAPGAAITAAFGINNHRQVVGFTADLALTALRGFLLRRGVAGPFIPIDVPGAASTTAGDVKDLGQIVGAFRPAPVTPQADGVPPLDGAQPPAAAASS